MITLKKFLFVFLFAPVWMLQAQSDYSAISGQFILLTQADFTPLSFAPSEEFTFRKIADAPPLWRLNYRGNLSDSELLDWLKGRDEILLAQHDHKLDWRETTPNDSNYFRQWHLKNTDLNTPGLDIDAELAWDSTTGGVTSMGDTIVIALIDSKVDLDHVDLNFFINRFEIPNNGFDDDSNGYVDDYYGWNTIDNGGNFTDINVSQSFIDHGTHIAGIMGAIGNNGRGVSGVNWNVKVLPIVTNLSVVESEVAAAYAYAIKMKKDYLQSNGSKGAFIVASNSSFGVNGGIPANYPIWCALYDSLGAVGILNAGATTNTLVDVGAVGDIPSLCPSEHLIVVTNSDKNDIPVSSGYSSIHVDLAAPGTAIYSTKPDNSYGNKTGTSMASPNVAGAIALLYSNFCPEMIQASYLFPDSISLMAKEMILESVEKLDGYRGRTVTEGRLNVGRAMLLSRNFNCNNCSFDPTYTLIQPNCAGASSGSILSNLSSPPFVFEWSSGDSGSDLLSASAGLYWVKVSDSACTNRKAFFLSEPQALSVSSLNINSDSGSSNGSVAYQVIGGVGMIEYSLDSMAWQSLGVFQNLSAGSYTLYARDSFKCVWDTTVSIISVGINSNWNEGPLSLYPNPVSDFLILENPEQLNLNIRLFNSLGQDLKEISSQNAARIKIVTSDLSPGFYFLQASTDSNMGWSTTIIRR